MVTIRTSITVYSFLISYIKMRDSLLKLIYIREHFTKREIKTVNEFLVWGLEVNFFSLKIDEIERWLYRNHSYGNVPSGCLLYNSMVILWMVLWRDYG